MFFMSSRSIRRIYIRLLFNFGNCLDKDFMHYCLRLQGGGIPFYPIHPGQLHVLKTGIEERGYRIPLNCKPYSANYGSHIFPQHVPHAISADEFIFYFKLNTCKRIFTFFGYNIFMHHININVTFFVYIFVNENK